MSGTGEEPRECGEIRPILGFESAARSLRRGRLEVIRMTKLSSTIAAILALVSTACSDDDGQTTARGSGGNSGTGGTAASGGAGGAAAGGGDAGSAGTPSCTGTQTTDEKFSQAMQVLRDIMTERDIPGGALAVVKDGKLVNLGVAGSKRAKGVCDPITPDTLFPISGAASATHHRPCGARRGRGQEAFR